MNSLIIAAVLSSCVTFAYDNPAIAIIIDDLGNRPQYDGAVLDIPNLKSVAILPFSPLTKMLARRAHAADKEVLLHLPMEAKNNNHLLGPGALRTRMAFDEFVAAVRQALNDVPHRSGVNNHMGSLLTQDERRMAWLMEELNKHPGLLYVDSRTTTGSAARSAAHARKIPYIARDVFLDNLKDENYIGARLDELMTKAREKGEAVGIAHPHRETINVLSRRLGDLAEVKLLSVKDLLKLRECRQAKGTFKTALTSPRTQCDDRCRNTQATEYPNAKR